MIGSRGRWVDEDATADTRGGIMQLTLTDEEAQALVDAVKSRLDTLVAGIAKADARDFREMLVHEGDVLEAIYRKLGCEHPEWTEARECEVPGNQPTGG
jgi:hypothetical protein